MRSFISRREHVWAIPLAIYIARWQYQWPRRTERRQYAGMSSHHRILGHRTYTLSLFLQDLIQANENLKAGLLHQQTPTPSPSPSPSPPSPTPSPPGDFVREAVSATLNSENSSLQLQHHKPLSCRVLTLHQCASFISSFLFLSNC